MKIIQKIWTTSLAIFSLACGEGDFTGQGAAEQTSTSQRNERPTEKQNPDRSKSPKDSSHASNEDSENRVLFDNSAKSSQPISVSSETDAPRIDEDETATSENFRVSYKIGGDEGVKAMVILLQDTSSTMSSFNAKYGNVIANQVGFVAEDVGATFIQCQNGGTKATAINNVTDSFLFHAGISTVEGAGCPPSLKDKIESLSSPTNLVLYFIVDYPPESINAIATQAKVDSLTQKLSTIPHVNNVHFAGAIRAISSYWSEFAARNDALIEDGSQSAEETFKQIAQSVKEKVVTRTFEFDRRLETNEMAVTLNDHEIPRNLYAIQDHQITIDPSVDLNVGDLISIQRR